MSPDNDYRPKLRNVEPVMVVLQGRQAVALKDPLALTDRMVCVGTEALPVLALLDGRHSVRDIQWELTRRTGSLVFSDAVEGLLNTLDEAFLLEGPRYQEQLAGKVAEYRSLSSRPASHAGLSYNADPEELRAQLASFFEGPGGPGPLNHFSDSRRPTALIAPHIDIRSGGRCFAHGYHALACGQPSDLYIILGTGHSGVQGFFAATSLDFETPLGTVRTDREFLQALAKEFGQDPCAEEILHLKEHVIEFQAVFLQYILGGRRDFRILPVLVSITPTMFGNRAECEAEKALFDRFCTALKEVMRKSSKSVCFIASADLDHIGPRYGDSFVPHHGTVRDSLEKDRSMITHLEQFDVEAFIGHVARENDTRRICGFSPITAMVHCMDACPGTLLDLDFVHVDDRNSFVSFCSMIFHESTNSG
jgi:AmmeMemoRadiSam system protein B